MPGCVDKNSNCHSWASRGECTRNPGYMKVSGSRNIYLVISNGVGEGLTLRQNCRTFYSTLTKSSEVSDVLDNFSDFITFCRTQDLPILLIEPT